MSPRLVVRVFRNALVYRRAVYSREQVSGAAFLGGFGSYLGPLSLAPPGLCSGTFCGTARGHRRKPGAAALVEFAKRLL
jgi:hypothetical protein